MASNDRKYINNREESWDLRPVFVRLRKVKRLVEPCRSFSDSKRKTSEREKKREKERGEKKRKIHARTFV